MARAGLVTLLAAGFVLAGCSGVGTQPEHIPVIPETTAADPSPAAAQPGSVVEPSQLLIDKIGVNTGLKPTGLDPNGVIHVPDLSHVDEADWLCAQHTLDAGKPVCKIGAVPGAVGPAVIVGHIDGKGKEGVFFKLKDMAVGDDVAIRRTDGSTLNFKVSKVTFMPKDHFDTKSVYGNVDHAELRLISCGGPFVGGATGYADNIVVFADLV